MNKLFYIFSTLFFLNCNTTIKETQVYSILYDTTDPLRANPNKKELLNFMDIDNANKIIQIRYLEISDVDFNKVTELIRPCEKKGLFSNQILEKQKKELFRNKLDSLLKTDDTLISSSYSSIFKPILAEVQYLEGLPSDYKKHLIIYSDLMENNHWLSFYSTSGMNLMNQNPEKLLNLYIKEIGKLPILTNVKVHIVFIPKDQLENRRFQKLQQLYLKIFKDHLGVPISFSANLTKAQRPL